MGEYKYMFDEELITWSIDGGGTFFFRPKHKFSITNVSGYLRAKPNKFNYRFLHSVLHHQHSFLDFDYQIKAHPSVIRELYKIPIVPLSEQESLAEAFENAEIIVEQGQNLITALKKQKRGLMQQLLTASCACWRRYNKMSNPQFRTDELAVNKLPLCCYWQKWVGNL